MVSPLSKYGTTNAESGFSTTVYVAFAPSGNEITSSRSTKLPDVPRVVVPVTANGRPFVRCSSLAIGAPWTRLPRPRPRRVVDPGRSRRATDPQRAFAPARCAGDDPG